MNCEQIIRNSKSVNELIYTGYSPNWTVQEDAARRDARNSHNVFEERSLKLFTSEAHPKKAT